MKSVVIVVPVFNRRETTLRCLEKLKATGVFSWASVIVVDDASSDGTTAAIQTYFPDVMILQGDGNLWWAGGINAGMKYAFENSAEYIIWLNDDCVPVEDALHQLYQYSQEHGQIAVGQSFCPTGSHYGGHRKTYRGLKLIHCPLTRIVPCDAFGGNAVCIPREIVEKIGYLDAKNMPMDPAGC